MKRDALPLAALLRVSTLGQCDDRFSLPQQEASIRAYCAQHGHTLVEVLADEGLTGRRQDRPAVRRTLELLAAGQIVGVVTARIDRLGRYASVIHAVLNEIRQAGGRVLYCDLDIPDTPAGRFLENALIGVSQFESELTRERTVAGKREKASAGRYPSGLRIYGYSVLQRWQEHATPEYAGRSGELVEHETEAELVRELYRRFDAGESVLQLIKWLNEAGRPAPRGGVWRHSTLRKLLRNPTYLGELVYGRSRWTLLGHAGQRGGRAFREEARPEPEWQRISVPALLERPLWERVQVRLASAAETMAGYPSRTYLLRGCLECATCVTARGPHRLLVGRRENSNSTRPGYRRHRYCCAGCLRSVQGPKLEARAITTLRRAIRPDVIRAAAQQWLETQEQVVGDQRKERLALETELRGLDSKEERLAELRLEGFTPATIARQVAKLNKQRESLLARLRAAPADSAPSPDAVEQAAALAQQVLDQLAAAVSAAEAGDQGALQDLFRRYVRGRLYEGGRVVLRVEAPVV